MKKIITVILLLISTLSYSQNSNINLENKYPNLTDLKSSSKSKLILSGGLFVKDDGLDRNNVISIEIYHTFKNKFGVGGGVNFYYRYAEIFIPTVTISIFYNSNLIENKRFLEYCIGISGEAPEYVLASGLLKVDINVSNFFSIGLSYKQPLIGNNIIKALNTHVFQICLSFVL